LDNLGNDSRTIASRVIGFGDQAKVYAMILFTDVLLINNNVRIVTGNLLKPVNRRHKPVRNLHKPFNYQPKPVRNLFIINRFRFIIKRFM
jgi:hypothetical protein